MTTPWSGYTATIFPSSSDFTFGVVHLLLLSQKKALGSPEPRASNHLFRLRFGVLHRLHAASRSGRTGSVAPNNMVAAFPATSICSACQHLSHPHGNSRLTITRSPLGTRRGAIVSGGGRIRTCDLEVMSLPSYRTAPPRYVLYRVSMAKKGSPNTGNFLHQSGFPGLPAPSSLLRAGNLLQQPNLQHMYCMPTMPFCKPLFAQKKSCGKQPSLQPLPARRRKDELDRVDFRPVMGEEKIPSRH